MEYKTKQIGWMVIILISLIIIGFFVVLQKLVALDPSAEGAFYATSGVLILLVILFYQMETIVTDKQIVIKFGIGLIKKTIQIEDIETVSSVKNSWWYGWGIRLTPHGWLWNISGYEAVELKRKSKSKSFRIGCKNNSELEEAIMKRL